MLFNNSVVQGVWNGQDCLYTVTCYQCDECPTGRTRNLKKEQIQNKKCSDFTNSTTKARYVASCEECEDDSDYILDNNTIIIP